MNDYNRERNYDPQKHKNVKFIESYAFNDENNVLLFEKLRFLDLDTKKKFFRFRRPNPDNKDEPIYNLNGITAVPYRLSSWKDKPEITVCEGEKDANAMAALCPGLETTCAPFRAGSWPEELTPWFKEKKVYICYDVGNESDAEMVADNLLAVAKEVFIINLPSEIEEYDLSDYLEESKDRKAETIEEAIGEAIGDLYEKYATRYEESISYQSNSVFEGTPMDNEIEVANSFLCKYVEIHSKITDAPQHFILFSGLALLSAMLNYFYFVWAKPTNLNLYILLLAQSTTERKSTLIDIVYDYLKRVEEANFESTNLIFPSTFSPEALFDILEKRNRGIILWRELSTVKALFGKAYGKGLPSTFTDIWDGRPVSQHFKKEGFRRVDNPVVSILCGGIGEWLVEGLRRLDFQGGLWTRFIFVPAASGKKSYRLPGSFPSDNEIIQELYCLAPLSPKEMNLEKVKPMFEDWMVKLTEEKQNLGNAIAETFYNKLEINVLKIACLLQLATDHSVIVEKEAMEDAIIIGEWLKRQLPNLLRDFLQSDWDRERARIINVLERRSKPTSKEIYQFANIDARSGIKHLENLIQEGLVGSRGTKSGTRGRPGRRFFLIK